MSDRPARTPRPAPFAAAALCVLISTGALAGGAQPRAPVSDWPILPNSATSGGFAVAQHATDDAQAFLKEWSQPTPSVQVHGTTQFRRNRPIESFITFRGCRADAAGRCNVTATFALTGPAGKVDRFPPMEVWTNRPQPTPGMIWLSRRSLGMTFTENDPLGTYLLQAAVTDHVAGVTLHTRQTITVLK